MVLPRTQACPADAGTVTGTIAAADVVAIAGQNVSAGDFDALEDAITSNTAYGNIHTAKFPAGEIRGQIRRGDRDDDR
jgi:CHRD domain